MNKLKKKPVDYSGFSLRRLNEPRFSSRYMENEQAEEKTG